MTQCATLPEPVNNSFDAQTEHLSQVYALYGLCAGKHVELIKKIGSQNADKNN